MNSLIIPDASTILAYVLNEPAHQNSIQQLFARVAEQEVALVAPSICGYEIANRLMCSTQHTAQDVAHILDSLEIVQLHHRIVKRVYSLFASHPKISFYDASYHALAIESDGVFLTADKQYVELMQSAGNIQFIGDYQ